MVRFPGISRKPAKLYVEYIAPDDSGNNWREETFVVSPSTPFFLFKKDVAEKLNVPSVDLFFYRRGGKHPIPLEDDEMIVGALKSGERLLAQRSEHRPIPSEVVIAEHGQCQTKSSGKTPDTLPPLVSNKDVPKPPTTAQIPAGMLDHDHVTKLKDWVEDTQKQSKEYEHSMIEATKKIRNCLEERKKFRSEQISTLEAQIADLQMKNRQEENECSEMVKAVQRTAQGHYANVNRKLKIVRALMESIDSEVADTIPTEISVKPFWTYDGDFGVEGAALSVTTPSSFASERSASGAECSVQDLDRSNSAPNSAHPRADVSPTVANNDERKSPGTATVISKGFVARDDASWLRDHASGMRNESVGETVAQGMGSATNSTPVPTRNHMLRQALVVHATAREQSPSVDNDDSRNSNSDNDSHGSTTTDTSNYGFYSFHEPPRSKTEQEKSLAVSNLQETDRPMGGSEGATMTVQETVADRHDPLFASLHHEATLFARYKHTGEWFLGRVRTYDVDGTFTVCWEDGTIQFGTNPSDLRRMTLSLQRSVEKHLKRATVAKTTPNQREIVGNGSSGGGANDEERTREGDERR